ncbi:universal stress protein [Streptomyces bambusae]|uniref:universal stress protein n=1 Tax=Streptomyces bambusae TaxID=1550616 RepID=UPI001CFD374A|nr:universal stress protein [Streptomyces bambusae]MCB5165425.1 universal stress protein [Streptomyces bambusae]
MTPRDVSPGPSHDRGGPVVVAVDGSDHSLKALDWALAAGRAAGAEVVVAHVLPDHAQIWQARRTAVLGEPDDPAPDPVAEAVRRSLDGRGDLPPVRYASLAGAVPDALEEQALRARMLVMGSRGRGGFASLLLGSNSRVCATRAACPVVVVPHAARAANLAGGPAVARVVLGLNPAETADDAVGFAFARAAEHAMPLTVVSAFLDPVAALPLFGTPGAAMAGVPLEDPAPLIRELERAQQERLAPFRAAHPGVAVASEVGAGDAAGQLVAHSETAALLVVGRHRTRRHADSLLMGSVANAALLHARCPVAVVPAS